MKRVISANHYYPTEEDNVLKYPVLDRNSTRRVDILNGTDIDSDIQTIQDAIEGQATEFMVGTGYLQEDIPHYLFVDVNPTETGYHIEVRAELDYDDLMGMASVLDSVVTKFDPGAYFEPVSPGILESYLHL